MNGPTSEQVRQEVIEMLQSTVDCLKHIEFSLSGQKFSVIISRDNNLFDCCLATCVGDISYSRNITSSDEFDEALGELKTVCAPKQK
jgi:hypothetical protein